jgi:hypothetical protein
MWLDLHVKFHPSFRINCQTSSRINNNSIETFFPAYLIAFCAISTDSYSQVLNKPQLHRISNNVIVELLQDGKSQATKSGFLFFCLKDNWPVFRKR